MDALTGLLDGPRARGAFLLRASMDPPWSVRVQDEAPLSLVAIARGTACVYYDGDEPTWLRAGDVVLLRGPDPYTFADDPATPSQVVIHPGEHCATPDGRDLTEEMSLGVRSWGNSRDGALVMLIGTYQVDGDVGRRLVAALPRLIVLSDDCPVVPLFAEEIVRDEPGQEAMLDRLLDLMVIAVLRSWLAGEGAPRWCRAQADPVVGRALKLLHNNPAYPWTVGSLASRTGVSRATLARRFTEQVGEPPMSFLTGWRLDLAADLLREPDATLGAVARQVGYGTGFALSAAFKRVRGLSPREHRVAS